MSFGPHDEFDPNDDWHWTTRDPKCKLDPKDVFVHWRRWYMNWHTEDEQRKDAKKRMESQRTFERFIAVLDELKKHSSEKKQMRSAKKNIVKNHAKHRRPIAPRIKILKRQRTARPPAEEAGDVADAQCECTPSSSHSWMPSPA